VKDINEAYERAFKKYPITVPLGGRSFTASAGATGLGVGIEQDPQLVRYLIWFGQLPEGGFGEQAAYAEQSGTPLEDVAVLAAELERDGLIDPMGTFGAPDAYRITSDGRVELRRLSQLRSAPAARHRYATDGFLRWLYATAHDQRPTDPAAFLGTTEWYFAGSALSETELDYALARPRTFPPACTGCWPDFLFSVLD
jgi:hypothetical protein